jgi:hypothetical protein
MKEFYPLSIVDNTKYANSLQKENRHEIATYRYTHAFSNAE